MEKAAENIASLGSIGNIASIGKRVKRAAGNIASLVTRRQTGPFFEQSLLIDPKYLTPIVKSLIKTLPAVTIFTVIRSRFHLPL